jgi:hypothetical protein
VFVADDVIENVKASGRVRVEPGDDVSSGATPENAKAARRAKTIQVHKEIDPSLSNLFGGLFVR